jgi:hypothetical protein
VAHQVADRDPQRAARLANQWAEATVRRARDLLLENLDAVEVITGEGLDVAREALAPWLGLHYPADDIPQPARDRIKAKVMRRFLRHLADRPEISDDTLRLALGFDRATLAHVGAFRGPATLNTDGIALTQRPFGAFPAGAFFAVVRSAAAFFATGAASVAASVAAAGSAPVAFFVARLAGAFFAVAVPVAVAVAFFATFLTAFVAFFAAFFAAFFTGVSVDCWAGSPACEVVGSFSDMGDSLG